MARSIDISQIGGSIGGGNSTGIPSGAGTPPGNVSAITVTGYLDPVALEIFLTITYTPPVGGTFSSVSLFLDIPDHGSATGNTVFTVGSSTLGDGSAALGPFNPIALGVQPIAAQPWTISTSFPGFLKLDPNTNIPCRLYIASGSAITVNALVQEGLANATPNAAFTLVSEASGSPTAGTNVTANCGTIDVQVLPNDNSTGKLMTPFLAIMGSVPNPLPKNWGYRLYICYNTTTLPTLADLTPVSDVLTVAGICPPSKSDLVNGVLNSFAIATPASVKNAAIWAVAGLTINGVFTPNNIVLGITNSCPVSFGSNSGVIDASQVIASSISAELTTALGKLGIAASGIDAAMLAPATALANLANGSLTGNLFAAQTITASLIANNTITGTLLATSGIITSSAQIGTAVVADANIASCNVSKLVAGTATFTSTVTFASNSGPSVVITSTQVEITGGTYTIAANASSGISLASSGSSLAITSSAITISQGSYSATFGASSIVLAYSGGPNLSLFASSIYLTATANDYIEVVSGTVTITSSGLSTIISGNNFTTGTVLCAVLEISQGFEFVAPYATSSSATAGSDTLPSNPAGFLPFSIGGVTKKIPYYNN